ncbi:MAG: hypothetical protein PQJ50_02380 [Spirochaetales bacterium]|nr:hypothetical protein [Spirochaetales bacterium]
MNKIRILLAAVLLTVSLIPLTALEQKDNSSRIVFDEKYGTWSLYYNFDGRMLPLFEDSDSRTSYTDIIVDNRTYRLQKNSFFNQHTEDHRGYIVAHWSNNVLHVTESVQVDHSIKGFRITLTVRNLSRNYLSVGFKKLIDTHNNPDGPDFLLEGNRPVNSERQWSSADAPEYWGTYPLGDSGNYLTYTSLGDRRPDRLVFSNWKRLNDSGWDYSYREGRDFSLLPYSINDSAAAVYFNTVSIPPGTEIAIQYALTAGGPVRTGAPAAAAAASPAAGKDLNERQIIMNYALGYDLELIDKLIGEINMLLKNDDPVYNSQTDYYESELEKLKQKLSHYENLQ